MPRELLTRALAGEIGIPLDVAALDLATFEFPELDPAPYLGMLDEIATKALLLAGPDRHTVDIARALSDYLGGTMGLRGAGQDYYNPLNSCLNYVLDSRTGIPITLSVVYIEVARRMGASVAGIGLPGHFIVQYQGRGFSPYLDPFHGGRFLTEHDCVQLALDVAQTDIAAHPAFLRPVDNVYILTRMLNNLARIYESSGEYAKAVLVFDLLIDARPAAAELYKHRAAARVQLRQFTRAIADFQSYLERAPEAADGVEVAEAMRQIQTRLRGVN